MKRSIISVSVLLFISFSSFSAKNEGQSELGFNNSTEVPFKNSNHNYSIQDSPKFSNPPKVNIAENQRIRSPLKIVVKSNEDWKAYGKTLGSVTLLDANDYDKAYSKTELLTTEENWTTNDVHNYTAILEFDSTNLPESVLFFEYYPESGKGKDSKYLTIPVRIKH